MSDSYEHLKAHFDRIAEENRQQRIRERRCCDDLAALFDDPLLGIHANNVPVAGKNRCEECAEIHRARRLAS